MRWRHLTSLGPWGSLLVTAESTDSYTLLKYKAWTVITFSQVCSNIRHRLRFPSEAHLLGCNAYEAKAYLLKEAIEKQLRKTVESPQEDKELKHWGMCAFRVKMVTRYKTWLLPFTCYTFNNLSRETISRLYFKSKSKSVRSAVSYWADVDLWSTDIPAVRPDILQKKPSISLKQTELERARLDVTSRSCDLAYWFNSVTQRHSLEDLRC